MFVPVGGKALTWSAANEDEICGPAVEDAVKSFSQKHRFPSKIGHTDPVRANCKVSLIRLIRNLVNVDGPHNSKGRHQSIDRSKTGGHAATPTEHVNDWNSARSSAPCRFPVQI